MSQVWKVAIIFSLFLWSLAVMLLFYTLSYSLLEEADKIELKQRWNEIGRNGGERVRYDKLVCIWRTMNEDNSVDLAKFLSVSNCKRNNN